MTYIGICSYVCLGELSVEVHAWGHLNEVTFIFINSTIVWPQVNNREGTQLRPSTKNWIKIYWAWPCPLEQDPDSPSVSLSHQEASISLLSFSIRGQTDWEKTQRKLTNLITRTTVLSNSMKLWARLCRATWDQWVMRECSKKNVVHWRRDWQTTSVFLPWEPHEQYEKVKR